MKVLIDSSVRVAYFRGVGDVTTVDWLIEEGLIVTNDLVLAELTPPLLFRGERKLVSLIREIECVPLKLDWHGISNSRTTVSTSGNSGITFSSRLIIAQ